MEWILWLGAGLLFAIIEVLSVDFIFLMLAIAAGVTGLSALAGLGLIGQVIVFCVTAVVLLLLVRPWAKRTLARTVPNVRTNVQGLLGREAVAVTRVTRSDGRVRIGGETWSGRSSSEIEFPAGTHLRVMSIDGATAVVAALDVLPPSPRMDE